MKTLFEKIFKHVELVERPPVLADIGASGGMYAPWKEIAPYSICIAFDPDTREMAHTESGPSPYRKLCVRNSIVVADNKRESDFYLTRSPFCSSTLPPETEKLTAWTFAPLFDVEKKLTLKAENLKTALEETGLDRIDWFKTDTQGTDLCIFKSIPQEISKSILCADMEPGFIDAYRGEDKAWQVLQHMEKTDFWLADMKVRPVKRLQKWVSASLSEDALPALERASADAAGWAEMSYLRTPNARFGVREYLLLSVFAILKRQYGFAIEVARAGRRVSNDPLFSELETAAIAEARLRYRASRLKSKLFAYGGRWIKKLL